MTARANRKINFRQLVSWLDVLALLAWGGLLIKLTATGQLRLLIHPNYTGLVVSAGIVLLCVGCLKSLGLWQQRRQKLQSAESPQHLTLFPLGWSTGLLLAAAIAGFLIPPKILASDTALQRGITKSLPRTQTQTQSFRATIAPEDRSIVDWVRTLNAYPEPDAYTGERVEVTGFVVNDPALSGDYLFLCRFIITCCAVDASPVGLPIQLADKDESYPNDTWLEVKGKMTTTTIAGKRQLAIVPDSLEKIPTPKDPYSFNE